MIFVDTSAFYAAVVPTDPHHERALAWSRSNRQPLLTTDYVVDELLTLLRIRGQRARALEMGEALFAGKAAELHWVTRQDAEGAWGIFRGFSDKGWSFTDCVSRVVMERRRVRVAFALDAHFRQFGTVEVVP